MTYVHEFKTYKKTTNSSTRFRNRQIQWNFTISRNFYISTHSTHTIIESGARRIYNNLMNFISTLESTLTAKNASCYSIYLELIFFPSSKFPPSKGRQKPTKFHKKKFLIIIFKLVVDSVVLFVSGISIKSKKRVSDDDFKKY